MDAIVVSNVSYMYGGGQQVLDGCSLVVRMRRVHGLIGPNGAGKSTLLELLARQRVLQRGTVRCDSDSLEYFQLKIGLVTTDHLLYPDIPFSQFTERYFGPALGLHPASVKREARKLVELLELGEHYHKTPGKFSHGTRVKASILLALVEKPDFVILDEPFNGLDVGAVDHAKGLLGDYCRENKAAVLIADHQLDVLEELVDDVSFMVDGRVESSGSREEFLSKHSSLREAYRAIALEGFSKIDE